MITISMEQAMAELGMLVARTSDLQPWLRSVGDEQAQEAEWRIFRTKISPDGTAWAPWGPRRQQERAEKGNLDQGLLWDTGALMHSFSVEALMNSVTIGTPLDYAIKLQEGWGMEPRPFLGWSETDFPLIEASLLHYLETGVVA